MKPSRFHYFDPASAEDAVALLGEHGDEAKVLAGGQSLMPLISMRLARVGALVDINRATELEGVARQDGSLRIGALTRHVVLEESDAIASSCPLLARAARWIGHRGIRNRGTVGGSLAHADPAAELPAVMTALGATVTAARRGGSREIPIEELFELPLMSTLAPDELLTSISVPVQPDGAGSAVVEVARRHGDFALAGVAASLTLDGDGAVQDLRLAAFATGPTPLRLREAEAAIAGSRPSDALLQEAGRIASGEIAPTDDIHATAAYRRKVTAVLLRRAVAEAVDDARRTEA